MYIRLQKGKFLYCDYIMESNKYTMTSKNNKHLMNYFSGSVNSNGLKQNRIQRLKVHVGR